MKYAILLFIVTLSSVPTRAQEENKPSPFTVNGYLETYYIYDFNKPLNNTRPGYIYAFNRHNEVNLNIGMIKVSYNTDNVRANLGIMAGTYPNANLATEPGVLKNIYETNVGIRLSAKKNLWVDAGIFSSHIGFESAIGKDCWTLTRTILADNSPYYEAGAKVSYTSKNGKWFLSGLILNGWQRIQRVDGNSIPSFGTQVTLKPSDRVTLNSSTFTGTDKPDSARLMRYFHNFYSIFQVNKKLGVTVGFDYGMEEKSPDTNSTSTWYSPVLIVRYAVTDKIIMALRGEYYSDKHGVIIYTGTPNGFQTSGISFNIDYLISANVCWRTEVRRFFSRDRIFKKDDEFVKDNTAIATSLCISL